MHRLLASQISLTTKTRMSVLLDRISARWRVQSYSQFGEDAFVYSYFRGKERPSGTPMRKGFYVDIGAFSPFACSNTKLFHRRGWRGINIDPTPGVMDAFRVARPDDVNLEVGIGSHDGEMTFYTFGVPCVLNTSSHMLAAEASQTLGYDPRIVRVPVVRLDSVLGRYAPEDRIIDFMSIDVEGNELDVVQSNDWSKYRPEVLAVERHGQSIRDHLDSPLVEFLFDQGYELLGWLQPTLILRDRRGKPALNV
jgi:FkbM family methyltransferase